jgi:two-component system phosphate regulon sensor histidine kinase PhoR
MSRIQLKWMGALVALVVVIALASGYLAGTGLRRREVARIELSLAQRTQLVIDVVAEVALTTQNSAELTELAQSASRAAGARVTLIAPDGTVVGDSDVALSELPRVENHAGRPEVRAALAGRVGSSTRRSETVGRELLYLAKPRDPATQAGVVRLAVDLDRVEAAVADLHRELLIAGALGLAAALGLSYLLSALLVRPLRDLRKTVVAIAGGDLKARVRYRSRDELGEIGQAINEMGEQLQRRVEQLSGDEEQLRAVLRSMVEGVLVIGSDGRIVLANPRLVELFGLHAEVEGRLPLDAIRSADVQDLLRDALRSLESEQREILFENRVLEAHAVGFPLGELRGAVAVFHDVTHNRQLEAIRRDFVANASHELKTPLTAIRGFAETLLQSDLPPRDAQPYLEIILSHSERLAALIDDLLELSRIESGKLGLEPVELDVAEVAAAALRNLEPRFRERSVATHLTDAGAPVARADRSALEQVLENLLDNAAKYTDSGGRVEVRIGGRDGLVQVEVADTGIGIPQADRSRIFERFYRVDKARSRALGGTGLGLAIVKHLVQTMGGEISVESSPGVGSTFRFTLPAARD